MEKVWLAFANTKKFNAIKCFHELGHSFWKMGTRKFSIGDIIYFYVSSEGRVVFKTRVDAINLNQSEWDDDPYWSEKERQPSTGKKRMKLSLIGEYQGDELNDIKLRYYGFPKKKSPLQQPVYKSYVECIDYIRSVF